RGRARRRPGSRLPRPGDALRRRARRRRRAVGDPAEPRDVVHRRARDGGQARPARLAAGRGVRHQGGTAAVKRIRFVHVGLAACTVTLALPASGVSKASGPPSSVGAGEGKLTLVAWAGYTEKQWVKPFEQKTGCKVSVKYANTSNDMFNLMTSGGGNQYDMVSASGDASLRLIYAGAVAETNNNLIPSTKE